MITRTKIGIVITILSMLLSPMAAVAQTNVPRSPTAAVAQTKETAAPAPKSERTELPTPRDEFRQEFGQFTKDIEGLGKQVEAVTKRLEGMAGATVTSRKQEIASLRDRLVQLGTKLQGDQPLAQAIDKYDSWNAAQVQRLNTLRQSLGPQFVENYIKRYQGYQAEVSNSRQMLNQQRSDLDAALRELTVAEMKAAEALLVEDAGGAVAELRNTMQVIAKTIDTIRARMRALGSAGV